MKKLFCKIKTQGNRLLLWLKSVAKLNKKGFSLIELLVVVAILGILAAVAIPAYQKYQQGAKEQAVRSSLDNVIKVFNACIFSDGTFAKCSMPEYFTRNLNLDAGIDFGINISTTNNKICFVMGETIVEDGGEQKAVGPSGCVEIKKQGKVVQRSTTTAQIQEESKCSSGVCSPATPLVPAPVTTPTPL